MNNTPSLKLEISLKLIISILIALALTAVVTYFATTQLSNPVERDLMREFKATPSVTSTSANQDSATDLESVDVLLVGLKQRLEAQPDDVDGWVLLSKSYYHLSRFKEAESAFEKAKALGYTGSWQPLPRIDSFSQNSASSINFSDYKINQDSSHANAAGSQPGATTSVGLRLKVSLNPALQKELSPDAAVFIFVRAVENPGPPLAVLRKTVGELPIEIALNDRHAMIPSRTISSARDVIVGARISVSGNPERQSGDYEQLSGSIPANFDETIELVINDKI
jgi:cytochrome c-type biogenesis protein CcmH